MDISAKGGFVKELKPGRRVDGLFLLAGMNKAETRAGKTYLALKVMDRSGEISGRVWDRAEHWFEQVKVGQVVRVGGLAQSYRDVLQLKVNSLEEVNDQEIDMGLFVPSSSFDIEQMTRELRKFARSVSDEFLNKLLLKFLLNKKFMAAFCQAPAAKRMHHAYVGGLLEHTLHVTRLADKVAELYPSVDRSLLLSGAILHDIGKISEFSFVAYPVDYSDQGRLLGHMTLGVEMIAEKYMDVSNFLYLGRGYNFPVALEGALKLKEISYIHAEGYPAAEMKHGPIALIDENMPVVFIATHNTIYEKVVSNIQEVKARSGKVIAIVTKGDSTVRKMADYVIEIPETEEMFVPLLASIPLQKLAYYIAVKRGCNVDQPRNLAKSVTVE